MVMCMIIKKLVIGKFEKRATSAVGTFFHWGKGILSDQKNNFISSAVASRFWIRCGKLECT